MKIICVNKLMGQNMSYQNLKEKSGTKYLEAKAAVKRQIYIE